ncbi:MAG: cytochrome c maturation protein CcmE [Rickettsia sp.]|nr:cytochrome c maturation protein CcmE [Rickettsia sp.]
MIITKKNNIYVILSCVFLIFLGIISLLYFMRNYMVFFYTPAEVLNMSSMPERFKIGGVVESSYSTEDFAMHFYISDQKDINTKIAVKFYGDLPFMFRDNQSVIVEGRMSQNVFLASKLLVKHDEVYYPPK